MGRKNQSFFKNQEASRLLTKLVLRAQLSNILLIGGVLL